MASKKQKAWAVCDPYCATKIAILGWFDTEPEAEAWLTAQIQVDEEGYEGCVVVPRDEALVNYA